MYLLTDDEIEKIAAGYAKDHRMNKQKIKEGIAGMTWLQASNWLGISIDSMKRYC